MGEVKNKIVPSQNNKPWHYLDNYNIIAFHHQQKCNVCKTLTEHITFLHTNIFRGQDTICTEHEFIKNDNDNEQQQQQEYYFINYY